MIFFILHSNLQNFFPVFTVRFYLTKSTENPATEGRELRRGSQVEPWDLVLMPTATELQDPRAEMSTADFHVSPMLVALSVDEIKARFPGMRMHRPNTKTHRSSI